MVHNVTADDLIQVLQELKRYHPNDTIIVKCLDSNGNYDELLGLAFYAIPKEDVVEDLPPEHPVLYGKMLAKYSTLS